MKILVAGGAGFIGLNLIGNLLKYKSYKITCIDNFQTSNKKNIKNLSNAINIINADIKKYKNYNQQYDLIINLACPASPPAYQLNPIDTIKTSFIGTLNLLELAKKNQSRFIQASTSEVYGDPHEHPQTEKYLGNVNPIGIRACYDEGKRAAETLCSDFNRQYGLQVNIVRIFNTYGPYMKIDDGRVVTNFINSSLNNKPLEIYGDGNQTRSFCYVDDLVDGFIKLISINYKDFFPLNLGNPDEFTMIDLANKIIKLTNSKSSIVFKKLPSDDPTRRKPDISRAKNILKWVPNTSLDRGIAKTIEYFMDLKNERS